MIFGYLKTDLEINILNLENLRFENTSFFSIELFSKDLTFLYLLAYLFLWSNKRMLIKNIH